MVYSCYTVWSHIFTVTLNTGVFFTIYSTINNRYCIGWDLALAPSIYYKRESAAADAVAAPAHILRKLHILDEAIPRRSLVDQ